MPDITLPHSFSDGNTTNADQLEENLFRSEVTPPTSFSVINGRLDDNNRQAGWEINSSHIQRGAMSAGKTVGSTTNFHYFSQMFPTWSIAAANDTIDKYQMIPGAGQTFYLPFTPSLVVFTWSLFAGYPDDTNPGAGNPVTLARIALFLDGVRIDNRSAPHVSSRNELEDLHTRQWAGHYFSTSLQQGWHSVGLGIASACDTANIRIKRLDYVYFR